MRDRKCRILAAKMSTPNAHAVMGDDLENDQRVFLPLLSLPRLDFDSYDSGTGSGKMLTRLSCASGGGISERLWRA